MADPIAPERCPRRTLSVILAVLVAALAAPASALAAGPAWMIETQQVAYLYPYRAAMRASALTIAEPAGSPAQGQVIHYTRVTYCSTAEMGYLMPCYGLADHAPAPGTIALYDNEKWRLTPSAEQADPCGSAVDFAAKVRAAGATPAIYLGNGDIYRVPGAIACVAQAAGPGGWMIMGQQDKQAHTRSYLSQLESIFAVADAAQSGLNYSFGLTTRNGYATTAYRLAQDFKTVRAAHPTWVCWLNVITWDGSQSKAVRMLSYLK